MFQNNPTPPPFFALVSTEGTGKRPGSCLRNSSRGYVAPSSFKHPSLAFDALSSVSASRVCTVNLILLLCIPKCHGHPSTHSFMAKSKSPWLTYLPLGWKGLYPFPFSKYFIIHPGSRTHSPYKWKKPSILIKPTLSPSLLTVL